MPFVSSSTKAWCQRQRVYSRLSMCFLYILTSSIRIEATSWYVQYLVCFGGFSPKCAPHICQNATASAGSRTPFAQSTSAYVSTL